MLTTGDLCRDILRAAHQVLPAYQQGAFYVVFWQGEFWVYPFPADGRWYYRVDPPQDDQQSGLERDWLFQVAGEWRGRC